MSRTSAIFTPILTVEADGATITGVDLDWSESLQHLIVNDRDADASQAEAYSSDGPGCVALDSEPTRAFILDAVRKALGVVA